MQSALAATWNEGPTDDGYGWDGSVVRYEFSAPRSTTEIVEAFDIAEEMLKPAAEDFVLAELARVRAMTISRDVGVDLQLVFAAYADELKRYPADVVKEVLREWPRSQRFWPSMAELTERLGRLVRPRRALHAALRRGYTSPEVSPDWTPPSADEKAAVDAYLAAHGFNADLTSHERPIESEFTTADRKRVLAELARFSLIERDPATTGPSQGSESVSGSSSTVCS